MEEPEFKSKVVWLPKENGLSQESQETEHSRSLGVQRGKMSFSKAERQWEPSTEWAIGPGELRFSASMERLLGIF